MINAKNSWAIWAGLAVLLLLMLLLNPSADRHRKAIQDDVDNASLFERTLGLGAVTAFMARYESLGIASYTTVNGKLASIGVLGLVVVVD